MLSQLSDAAFEIFAAIIRIALVFLLLVVGTDATTRMFYMYMPLDHWLTFSSVRVFQEGETARIEYTRSPNGTQYSVNHRSLLTFYPKDRLTCTKSAISIIEPSLPDTLSFNLKSALADNCEELLDGKPVEGRMRIAYIFEFPFGVKRMAIRYSNPFRLEYVNGDPKVLPAQNALATHISGPATMSAD